MFDKITAALLLVTGLVSPAFAQTATVRTDNVPVFRVVVVGRSAKAINFRPRTGDTKIDFAGTVLAPKSRGDATVRGKDGYIEIDANFEALEAPAKYGPEFLTYVVWAITPEGRAQNLGELQVSGDDGELRVTTELQAFGLIVTAEPYFAVTRPSDAVVLESTPRPEGVFQDKTIGTTEVIEAKYELLKRGTYVMYDDPSKLKVKPLEPGAPLDLAQARNAVAIAQIAGAGRYAAETFAKANTLLQQAEVAREQRKSGNEVQQPARQAAQTAEDARLIAMQRMEEEYQAQQKALSDEREAAARRAAADANAQAQSEAAARLQADAARQAAERARLDADADAARLALERQAAEAARLAAEQARAAAEAQASAAQASVAQAERERAELRDRLRNQLNLVLETRETARGLIVNVSDVLFDTAKTTLKPGAREKLARVAGILLAQPGLQIAVEGHADSRGTDAYNQSLSEGRAGSVRDYLVAQGINQGAVGTAGFGESRPVATNDTAAGRQQNRRVELVVTGEAIGRGN